MSAIFKKRTAFFFTIAIMASIALCATVFSSTAYSDEMKLSKIYKGTQKIMMVGNAENDTITFEADAFKPITKAKSSNKKVASVKVVKIPEIKTAYEYQQGHYRIELRLKKAGTTKVSFTYKGKKRSCTIKVVKYSNPFKTLTIKGKSFKKKFTAKSVHRASGLNDFRVFTSDGNFSGKIKVTPSKGWKLVKIVQVSGNKRIKNGGTINDGGVLVTMKNTKTGTSHTMQMYTGF